MKILVTGGAGFIGSAVCRHLVGELGHEVVNFDKLTYAACLASLAEIDGSNRYAFVQGDVADREAVRAAFETHRPDAVMHLAAESHVDRSIESAEPFVTTNIVGSWVMLEEATALLARAWTRPGAAAFRFLHISTDEVFGSPGRRGRLHRGHALRPALALFGVQGRVRPPGQRLAPHPRPAGGDLQLLQQLRALSLPREADPADHPQCARGPAAAGLRRRLQHPRLALCRGPRPRAAT